MPNAKNNLKCIQMNIIKRKQLIVDANANSNISIQQPTQNWESNINTKTVILAKSNTYSMN